MARIQIQQSDIFGLPKPLYSKSISLLPVRCLFPCMEDEIQALKMLTLSVLLTLLELFIAWPILCSSFTVSNF